MKIMLSTILISVICLSLTYADTTNENSMSQSVINISIYFIKESTKLYDISAEYPQIDKAGSEFNDKIKSLVETNIADFKKNCEETKAIVEASTPAEHLGEYPERPFYFGMFWEPTQLNSKYISFVLHLDYYEGGANGNQVVFAFNYDLLNNKEITLSDLLGEYPDYLKTISDYTIKELESNTPKDGNTDTLKDMLDEGAGPKENNFKNFTFTDNTINLYFSKYAVLPGSFGEQEVHIPRSIFTDQKGQYGQSQKIEWVSSDGFQFQVEILKNGDEIALYLGDKTLHLPRVMSASGEKYSDESFTFWEKGGEAIIMEDDKIIHRNCAKVKDKK